jgi:hypothetical protein
VIGERRPAVRGERSVGRSGTDLPLTSHCSSFIGIRPGEESRAEKGGVIVHAQMRSIPLLLLQCFLTYKDVIFPHLVSFHGFSRSRDHSQY